MLVFVVLFRCVSTSQDIPFVGQASSGWLLLLPMHRTVNFVPTSRISHEFRIQWMHPSLLRYARFTFFQLPLSYQHTNHFWNSCMTTWFSRIEINIERCVKDSVEAYCSTPKSAFCRQYDSPLAKNCSDLGRQVNLYEPNTSYSKNNGGGDRVSDAKKLGEPTGPAATTEKPTSGLKPSPSTDALVSFMRKNYNK